MPNITTALVPKHKVPLQEEGKVAHVFVDVTAPASGWNNADVVQLLELPAGVRIVRCSQSVGGTLGTSATVQARVGTTALCPASTAGGADLDEMNVFPPAASADGDIVNLLVGGANITASAAIKLCIGLLRA